MSGTVRTAKLLVRAIALEIEDGTKHFRPSDGKLLTTPREVLEALLDEGAVKLEVPEAK